MFEYLKNKFSIETYNVGVVLKPLADVLNSGICKGDIHWVRHNYKDRFFADPFLYNEDEAYYYILCEEFIFWEEKGKITLLTVEKNSFNLVSRRVIIEEPYHLSFPFCEFKGDSITPEASASGKIVKYFVNEKLNITGKTVIADEGLIDGSYITDETGTTWLFASKTKNPLKDVYSYREVNGKFVPSPVDVICSDERVSRSAGRFFRFEGNLYRPVQDCEGRYGRQTIIMHVQSFGETGYEASEVVPLNSFENPPYKESMHTFNVYENCIIVDGSGDFVRFPIKVFYKVISFFHRVKRK